MTDPTDLDREACERITTVSEAELDALPFGAIKLDPAGTVLAYNRAEAAFSERDPERVIGRNFFSDIAPCTDVKEFRERYRAGVAKGELHEKFHFVFDLARGRVEVVITLFFDQRRNTGWVFVRSLE